MKKVGRVIALLLLAAFGVLGLVNGVREWGDGLTGLQRSVTIAVLLYGVFGVLGFVGLVRRQRWVVPVTMAWTLASMWAGSVASFAFHDPGFEQQGTLVGVIMAALSILLVGAFVVWMAREAVRVSSPTPTSNIPTP
jgi:hypothetical protein